MSILRGIGRWALLFALVYGLRAAMGPALWWEFVGPYAKLGSMIWDRLPAWNHPILLVVYGAAALLLLAGWVRGARIVANAVVALFLVRTGFALVGEGSVPPPSLWLGAAAVLSLGWLMFSASFGDPRLWVWIRSR
ncbi:hypothetical protein Q8W71_28880 [Methylobacterium sp. NEAU 140]|uniref:hypothetical protein n=1 Tax=Methylobacterium sp. NEAU 140 TaxID=3064945 RepID=UPI0027371CF4|nr:hypothetical protein [Methylobacterium sp. NEAU 140]MDP4026628.1 hypothetical protein [Methylobacterium sp. NEAU 140]